MPNLSIEFEVYCGECGEGLCWGTDVDYSRVKHVPLITVKQCKCLKNKIEILEAKVKELEERGLGDG